MSERRRSMNGHFRLLLVAELLMLAATALLLALVALIAWDGYHANLYKAPGYVIAFGGLLAECVRRSRHLRADYHARNYLATREEEVAE